MSTLKVNSISDAAGANGNAITLATDGTCTAKVTNNLSNRNLIINGAMQIAQYGTSTTTNNTFCLDRWKCQFGGTDEAQTFTQHALTSSDTGPWSKGFRHSLHIQNGNQTSGAGASDYTQIRYIVEAQDIANSGWDYTSASSYLTLSFWIKSSVAQDFPVAFQTSDGTEYTYAFKTGSLSADTWTKVTKTIPGNSNLTVNSDNGIGLLLYFNPFKGTTWTGSVTEDTWYVTSGNDAADDMTSTWWTTDDSTYELTGVQLEVGSTATDYEHRSYGDELFRCQRYCCVVGDRSVDVDIFSTVVFYGANDARVVVTFPRPMRASPSGTISSGTDFWAILSAGSSMLPDSAAGVSTRPYHASVQFTDAVSGTAGNCGVIEPRETARMLFEAEL